MPTIEEAVAKYVELRDKKAEINKAAEVQVKRIDEALGKIEAFIMEQAEAQGVDSFATPHGTAFKKINTLVGIADRDTFNNFVVEKNLPGFFQARVNTSAVTEYIESGGELPPGLNIDRKYTISVRRK